MAQPQFVAHPSTLSERENEHDILTLLDRVGRGLSAGDLALVSSCWEFPALVLTAGGAVEIPDRSEIERLFARATDAYRSRGLVATRPEIQRTDELSDELTSVDVRWPWFDETGTEKSSGLSHYILRRGERGQRIQVALTRTEHR